MWWDSTDCSARLISLWPDLTPPVHHGAGEDEAAAEGHRHVAGLGGEWLAGADRVDNQPEEEHGGTEQLEGRIGLLGPDYTARAVITPTSHNVLQL